MQRESGDRGGRLAARGVGAFSLFPQTADFGTYRALVGKSITPLALGKWPMNWQALNPLRLVSASKNGVAAVWRRRPSLTKRTVAWGTALTMLTGGGGYYGYQKFMPRRPAAQVAQADVKPADDASQAGLLTPIPDENGVSQDPQVQPAADTQTAGGAFGGGQPGMFVGAPAPAADAPSTSESATGEPATGEPAAETGAYGSPAEGAMAAEPPPPGGAYGEGAPEAGVPADNAPGTFAGEAANGGEAGGGGEAAPEAPVAIVENARPRVMSMRDGPAEGADAAAAPEAQGLLDGSAPPPAAGDAASEASPSGGNAPAAEPVADLVPVPSRPQPSPPEEHVRLPAEAAPDLSPRPGMTGVGAGGIGLGAGAAASTIPRTFGGAAPPPPAPAPANSFTQPLPSSNSYGRPAEPSVLPESTGGMAMPLAASATPGAKHLEGPQTPSLELEKIAPEEVQVGRPARFEIKVRNVGRAAAQNISIVDQVPQGTRLVDANPPCQRGADGTLRWNLGALGPGQETSIVMQLLPEQEGEIGSVAQVIFHSQAAVRTVATRPQIRIEYQSLERALIGDQVKVKLAVINRGSGATSNLVLEATLPEGLAHPAGAELEYPIGALRPGETRPIELTLKAIRPGAAPCSFVAREDEQIMAEERSQMEIIAPQLQVGVNGPKVRYLDRQATYNVAIANPGTAPATNLELTVFLPRGLKFVSADNQGQYDSQRHAVHWGLAELPAGVMGASQLVVVPTEPGEQRIRAEAKADLRLEHAYEQPVFVETLSELQFSVVDAADPIEVGSEASYEIVVQNRGSRAATNVRVAVEFPSELTPTAGDGPTAVGVRGQQLVIEPLPRLAPNSQITYQIRAKGIRKGDPRIRVLVASDEAPTPVAKEESTRVYSDE